MKTGLLRQPCHIKKKKSTNFRGASPDANSSSGFYWVSMPMSWSKEMNLSSNPYVTSEQPGILLKQYSVILLHFKEESDRGHPTLSAEVMAHKNKADWGPTLWLTVTELGHVTLPQSYQHETRVKIDTGSDYKHKILQEWPAWPAHSP